MEFSYAVAIAIAVSLLLYYYLLSSRFANPRASKKKAPPEAGGAWPFIGHLHLLGGGGSSAKLPHFTLAAMADKYGPIFTIRIGVHRAVVVSNSDLAKELYTACDLAVSSRPKLTAAKHLGYDSAMLAFSPYGPYWRELRKLISVELLSSRRVELLKHVRVSETAQFNNDIYKLWEEKKNGHSGRVLIEMKQWLGNLNLDVLLMMVVGKRFSGANAGGNTAASKRYQEVLNEFFHLSGLFIAADALPYLRWLDLGGYEKKMKENAKELDEILGEWLEEHRRKEYSGKTQDFMDVMLDVVKDADFQCQYDADTIIKTTCLSLIAGGTDSTMVLLVWILSLLLNNRHVLKKAQEELDIQIGTERRVNESDIKNLVYLQAIVKETLRLYPPGPLGGQREFTEDKNVGGYYVPKGTRLIVNLWKLHRDPHVWSEDSLEFKPERFLTTHKNVDVKGQDFELVPFGAGRRICPGTNFGLQMTHLVLANILQAFELSTVSDELVDMTESAGLINCKATPLEVLVAPRLSPSLYN